MARHKYDTRLQHFVRRKREAAQDLRRYVRNKWPKGSKVSVLIRGVKHKGVLVRHGEDTIVVRVDDRRKVNVPHEQIIQGHNAL